MLTTKIIRSFFIACFALLATSCTPHPSNPQLDPYEGFNRGVFEFNRAIDKVTLYPAAKVYNFFTPKIVQVGVTNAFDNVGEITTMPNDLLQGKVGFFLVDIWRFLINSTVGVGGLFDVAKHFGLKRHYEDFGMTLAYWEGSDKPSPYIVLPVLGPSTFRQTFGMPFDLAASPWPYGDFSDFIYPQAINFVNTRSRLLPADRMINNSFDPYIFVRNAYLQRRTKMIQQNKNLAEHFHGHKVLSSSPGLQGEESVARNYIESKPKKHSTKKPAH